jgi:hypothetical protein
MNTKIIHDAQGRVIAQIQDAGSVVHVRDGQGRPLGRYIKSGDFTYNAIGAKVGSGDQLLRLVRG